MQAFTSAIRLNREIAEAIDGYHLHAIPEFALASVDHRVANS